MAVFISIQSITEVSRPGAFHLKIKYLNPPPVCFCLSGGRWKRHFPDIILVLFKANTDAVQIMGVICIRSIFPVVAAAAFISFHHGNEEGAAQVRILVGFQEGLKLPGAGTGVWPAACICKEGKGVDFIQCIFKFSMLRRMPACCHISSLTRLHIKTAGGWERDAGMGGVCRFLSVPNGRQAA